MIDNFNRIHRAADRSGPPFPPPRKRAHHAPLRTHRLEGTLMQMQRRVGMALAVATWKVRQVAASAAAMPHAATATATRRRRRPYPLRAVHRDTVLPQLSVRARVRELRRPGGGRTHLRRAAPRDHADAPGGPVQARDAKSAASSIATTCAASMASTSIGTRRPTRTTTRTTTRKTARSGRRRSSEVVDDHQLVDRRVDAGEEHLSPVSGRTQAEPDETKIAGDRRDAASGEIVELQPDVGLRRGS